MSLESYIKHVCRKHGTNKVKALIVIRENALMCEIDESQYKVEEGYKIGWKPVAFYAQNKGKICVSLCDKTFYQGDFDTMVENGDIKLYIEA